MNKNRSYQDIKYFDTDEKIIKFKGIPVKENVSFEEYEKLIAARDHALETKQIILVQEIEQQLKQILNNKFGKGAV